MEQTDVRLMHGGFCRATCDSTRRAWVKQPYHTLAFPVGGSAIYSLRRSGKETSTPMEAGNVYFLPAHAEQQQVCADWCDFHWLHFTSDSLVLDHRLAHLPIKRWSASEWDVWKADYTGIEQFFAAPSTHKEMRLHAMLLCFVAALLENSPICDATNRAAERFEKAMEFMNENFASGPRLQEIASKVHLSPPHFHRSFRETFQATPHEYMLRKRMELAYRLVANTDRKISDIADTCGYESPFYFSRVFKAYFRVSPRFLRESKAPPNELRARLP